MGGMLRRPPRNIKLDRACSELIWSHQKGYQALCSCYFTFYREYCILNVEIINKNWNKVYVKLNWLTRIKYSTYIHYNFVTLYLVEYHCLLCLLFNILIILSRHILSSSLRVFRAKLQKVLSFKIPQKDIGWTRKVTMNFSYIFYGISSHKKSFLTAFYLIFILDFFISKGERKNI